MASSLIRARRVVADRSTNAAVPRPGRFASFGVALDDLPSASAAAPSPARRSPARKTGRCWVSACAGATSTSRRTTPALDVDRSPADNPRSELARAPDAVLRPCRTAGFACTSRHGWMTRSRKGRDASHEDYARVVPASLPALASAGCRRAAAARAFVPSERCQKRTRVPPRPGSAPGCPRNRNSGTRHEAGRGRRSPRHRRPPASRRCRRNRRTRATRPSMSGRNCHGPWRWCSPP